MAYGQRKTDSETLTGDVIKDPLFSSTAKKNIDPDTNIDLAATAGGIFAALEVIGLLILNSLNFETAELIFFFVYIFNLCLLIYFITQKSLLAVHLLVASVLLSYAMGIIDTFKDFSLTPFSIISAPIKAFVAFLLVNAIYPAAKAIKTANKENPPAQSDYKQEPAPTLKTVNFSKALYDLFHGLSITVAGCSLCLIVIVSLITV